MIVIYLLAVCLRKCNVFCKGGILREVMCKQRNSLIYVTVSLTICHFLHRLRKFHRWFTIRDSTDFDFDSRVRNALCKKLQIQLVFPLYYLYFNIEIIRKVFQEIYHSTFAWLCTFGNHRQGNLFPLIYFPRRLPNFQSLGRKPIKMYLQKCFLQKKWIYKSICNKIFFRFYRKLKTVFHTWQ